MNSKIEPKVILASTHKISRDSVSAAALEVTKTLQDSGYQAYLVGGCVRDLLRKRKPKDFDIATDALPEQVKELFRSCRLIGRRFRLAHVRVGREFIEVATFRSAPHGAVDDTEEDNGSAHINDAGQILRDNVFGSIDEDAMRRDFTVNALYYQPSDETVIDYVGGVLDIEAGVLRTIGDPHERLREDPVRMLRAIRFSANLGFKLDPEVEAAIGESGSLLHHVPPARMLDEAIKMFHSGHALSAYEMLRERGMFRYLFPFTEQCIIDGQPNIPALALANTDKRIAEDKPVIPAFLFACLLWEPLRLDMTKLIDNGVEYKRAFATAANDLIRDQSQHVAIPRRISLIMHEMWSMQSSLERRPQKSIERILAHKRFRASYDFLQLRCETNEASREIYDWWTKIQEVDEQERREMIRALAPQGNRPARRRRRKRPRSSSQQSSAQALGN